MLMTSQSRVYDALNWAVKLLANAVDYVVDVLQNELRLEVSAKKSEVVASRSIAAHAAVTRMRSQKVRPARHAKLFLFLPYFAQISNFSFLRLLNKP